MKRTKAQKLWHKKNDHKYRDSKIIMLRNRRNERRLFLNNLKNKPCSDCGKTYPPICMDFDHIKGIKEYNVARLTTSKISLLLKEIDKCDVVCSNCHRIRTQKRNNLLS